MSTLDFLEQKLAIYRNKPLDHNHETHKLCNNELKRMLTYQSLIVCVNHHRAIRSSKTIATPWKFYFKRLDINPQINLHDVKWKPWYMARKTIPVVVEPSKPYPAMVMAWYNVHIPKVPQWFWWKLNSFVVRISMVNRSNWMEFLNTTSIQVYKQSTCLFISLI